MNINIPTYFNGYFIKHRFTSLLLDLGILNLRDYSVYLRFLEVADWRLSNPMFGCIQGTRGELLEKMFPNARCTQSVFNACIKRLVGLKLVKRDKKNWKIPNFHLHLSIKRRPEDFKKLGEKSESNFYGYLRRKFNNIEEKITETVISEVVEEVLLYLTDEEKWISYALTNKDNENTITEGEEVLTIPPEINPN